MILNLFLITIIISQLWLPTKIVDIGYINRVEMFGYIEIVDWEHDEWLYGHDLDWFELGLFYQLHDLSQLTLGYLYALLHLWLSDAEFDEMGPVAHLHRQYTHRAVFEQTIFTFVLLVVTDRCFDLTDYAILHFLLDFDQPLIDIASC